jgi:hypothetical protein
VPNSRPPIPPDTLFDGDRPLRKMKPGASMGCVASSRDIVLRQKSVARCLGPLHESTATTSIGHHDQVHSGKRLATGNETVQAKFARCWVVV